MTLIGSKRTGPNGIPTILLKQTRNTVSLLLAKLINKSFEAGIFPDICKLAKMASIFKSETRLLCNNCRFPCFQILVKSLKNSCMEDSIFFLEQYNCYYALQFCFRLNCSTNSALMSIVENILTHLDTGVLGPLLYIVHISDLHKCIKYPKAYQFADNTNILQSGKSLEALAKKLN